MIAGEGGQGPHDTVGRRVARAGLLIAALLAVIGVATTAIVVRSGDDVHRLTAGYGPARDANSAALTLMLDAETAVRGYALTGRTQSLQPYDRAIGAILPAIDRVRAALAVIDDHSLDAALDVERGRAVVWIETVARPSASDAAVARATTGTTASKALFDRFRDANALVSTSLTRTRDTLAASTSRQRRVVYPIVLVAIVLALGIAALTVVRTTSRITGPLGAVWTILRRLQAGDPTARADETAGPIEVRELSGAVNTLAVDRARAVEQQEFDERLRDRVRQLSTTIRTGRHAETMARSVVTGLGEVFGTAACCLVTLPDARIARLDTGWTRERGETPPRVEPVEGYRAWASRLWLRAGGIETWRRGDDAAADAMRPFADPVDSCVTVALGEGATAMGVLWLGRDDAREWSGIDLGLLQHIAGELTQNLMQNHVLVQQTEAVRTLREADEAKTALVSTVSHELRTPLTSILGYLDLALDAEPGSLPPGVEDMLRVACRNAERLKSLIDDLLTESQIQARRRLVTLSRIDVRDVVDDVHETVLPLAESKRLALSVSVPDPGLLVVDGDSRQLGQALTNLASNAIKFTPVGGSVRVTARAEGSDAVLEVVDSGMGIHADELPNLFERFYRGSNARAAVIPGTGLGLGIVREIVAQHAGSVTVQSTIDVGSRFTIRVPLAAGCDNDAAAG